MTTMKPPHYRKPPNRAIKAYYTHVLEKLFISCLPIKCRGDLKAEFDDFVDVKWLLSSGRIEWLKIYDVLFRRAGLDSKVVDTLLGQVPPAFAFERCIIAEYCGRVGSSASDIPVLMQVVQS